MRKSDKRGLSTKPCLDTGRLDVPGFSFGQKTGEFIDIPKIFGGKPQPRKSGKPHALPELMSAKTFSRARKALQFSAQFAQQEYSKRKRNRSRRAHKAITNDKPIAACPRRFFEFSGMKADFLPYIETPELFISRSKVAYEITDGLLPIMSVTSSREAQLICASLANYGLAVYFNQIKVPL